MAHGIKELYAFRHIDRAIQENRNQTLDYSVGDIQQLYTKIQNGLKD